MSLEQLFEELFNSIPHWLATIMISALPFSELRGAIPIAVGVYGMDPLVVYFLAVIGNMIPVIPLLLYLDPISTCLRRFKVGDAFFSWLFTRTHRKHSERFERYGTLALTIFVAIPLPMTGAWTGCVAAFVFGISFKHALMAISSGVLIAGMIVITVTLLGFSAINLAI
ncbi:MAG: small multi-drug export protein [Methanosarcinaceae archaeon]|nr:small multi-drug export protein [Methanosarcinaceae archaeon]